MTSPDPRFRAVARLAAIEASAILTTQRGKDVQDICERLCKALKGDRAQVNLITADQQVFIGDWPKPRFWSKPIALKDGGCREVVLADHTLAIPDTRQHPVMCLMPWVQEWRGYIGTPIHYDGQVLGVMCVLTTWVRTWQDSEITRIEGFAREMERLL